MRWLALLSLCLLATPAAAQDDTFAERAEVALRSGDLDAALRWARLARGDDPEGGRARLARVHEARGEHVAAHRLHRRGRDVQGAARTRARLGLVRVQAPVDATVTVDGEPAEWDRPGLILLPEGAHVLRARRPGSYVRVRHLTVEGGSTQSVALLLGPGREGEERSGGGPHRFEAEGSWRDANLVMLGAGAAAASGFAVLAEGSPGSPTRRFGGSQAGLSLGVALGAATHLGFGAAFHLERETPPFWVRLAAAVGLGGAAIASGGVPGEHDALTAGFAGAAMATVANLFFTDDPRSVALGAASLSFMLAGAEALMAFLSYSRAGALTGDPRFVAHAVANAEPCAAPPDPFVAQACADAATHRSLGAWSALAAGTLFLDAVMVVVLALTDRDGPPRRYALQVGPGQLGLRGAF